MKTEKHLITPIGHPALPADWIWKRLDEVVGDVIDCPHSTPILADTGPYLVRTQDVRSGFFDLEKAARVSESIYQERISRAEPAPGDLLFSREGTYFGTCALVPKGIKVCLGQRMVLVKANQTSDSAYVKYWINSPAMAAFIAGQKDGSVAERINMPWIRALPIAVPPLPIQRQIAAILSAFDDKIELNRRMNRTLEQMARALFKSWFVDFDPVRARMRGEMPEGMDTETAALFPDEMEEVAGREVPKGWKWRTVGELYKLSGGSTPSTVNPEFWEGGKFHWTSPKDLSGLDIPFLTRTEKKITEAGTKVISSGVLPAGTVLLSSRAPVGYLAISALSVSINQGYISELAPE